MRRFEELIVWKKAHQLVLEVYRVTQQFPTEERYGLTSQMRRAAVSVPANIVEGHKRRSKREFANFMSVAEGSLEELKYYFLLSRDLGYFPDKSLAPRYGDAEEVGRMLYGLKAHVNQEIINEKKRLF